MTQVARGGVSAVKAETQVSGPTVCLAFRERAEEAIGFYVSLFKNSRVLSMQRSEADGPIPKGALMSASFELDGRAFVAFDGGSSFSFTDGISLMVTCETQKEIDALWARLTEGGSEGRCGWLKDRFGVSWQIIPAELGKMLSDSKSGNSAKATQAMLQMNKLDVATLQRAYESGA